MFQMRGFCSDATEAFWVPNLSFSQQFLKKPFFFLGVKNILII